VLNKTDLVSDRELADIEARLRRLNPLAPIHRARRADVPLDAILGRGGFDLERIVNLEPEFLNPRHGEPGHVHDEHCDDDHHHHDHEHDDEISSVALTLHVPMDRRKVSRWLTGLVAKQGQDILRAKGIIDVKGEKRRLVFQSVHMVLEGDLQREWKPKEQRFSRIVFIGRKLDPAALKAGFEACVAA
jgi:G3E family GTPase